MSQTVAVLTPEQLDTLITEAVRKGLASQPQGYGDPGIATLEKLRRKEYLTDEEVEALYGLSAPSLRTKRSRGGGPVFVKDGARVLYSQKAVREYLETREKKVRPRS